MKSISITTTGKVLVMWGAGWQSEEPLRPFEEQQGWAVFFSRDRRLFR